MGNERHGVTRKQAMKNPSTGVLLGLLWLGLSVSAAAAAEGVDFRKDVFLRGTDGYHTYRIPTMVVTDKGTVLVFCEGRKRGRRDSGDVDQIMKRSDDGGKTWSKQTLIYEEGGDAPIRVGNPCPIVERNGKVVHLFFTRSLGQCLFYTKSIDDGKTWSKIVATSDLPNLKEYKKDNFLKGFGGSPVQLGAGPVHGIHTKRGRLIAPSFCGRKGKNGGSCIIFSDDGGKTWAAGGVIPAVKGLHHGECTVVERSDGSLLMNMRTGGTGLYGVGYRTVSVSKDRGMTWSKPVLDKNLPGPGCQGSMIRLNDKEILFLNPAVHRRGGFSIRSRRNLTLRLSKDDGRTWTSSRVLNKELSGYSDMAITKEGKILCLFENGKRDYCEKISIVQVDRAWLAAGKDAEKAAEPVRDVGYFLRRLRTLDHLPELEDTRTAMSSTWDRSGGNIDGFDYKRIESGGRNILLDVKGPACIHRIMAAHRKHSRRKGFAPDQKDTRIQIILDRADKPIIDMTLNDFLILRDKTPFPYPLVFEKSYPGCLHPIPFEKHCLVQLVNPNYKKPGWEKKELWGGWWQVTYTTYPERVKVKTLKLPLNKEAKLEQAAVAAAWLKAESSPPAVPKTWSVDRNLVVGAGKFAGVRLDGTGVIRQIRMAVDDSSPESLKALRLQMYWDGSDSPSVDVPVGYFFGHANTGHNTKHKSPGVLPPGQEHRARGPALEYSCNFNSLLIGVLPAEAYARFPMPFAEGAVARIRNTHGGRTMKVRLRLDVRKLETLPSNWGRFCATFSEQRAYSEASPRLGPKKISVKTVLQRQARGKYVGALLHVDWPLGWWWGEGDWLIWSDESKWPPSYHGTGTEDYFQGGGGQFDRKAVSGFVTGRPGHPTMYSFHLNDAFQFRKSIRVVVEQMGYGGADKYIRTKGPIWSSTAFWYAKSALSARSGKVLSSKK